jgi:hypothetical protein
VDLVVEHLVSEEAREQGRPKTPEDVKQGRPKTPEEVPLLV